MFGKKRRQKDDSKSRWKSLRRDENTIYRQSGILAIAPGLRYQILCVRFPESRNVGASLHGVTHLFWITYKPIRRLQDGAKENSVCLYSGGLSLTIDDRGDAFAWKVMTVIQRQLDECTQSYFLFHSRSSKLNHEAIYEYWKTNTDAAVTALHRILRNADGG